MKSGERKKSRGGGGVHKNAVFLHKVQNDLSPFVAILMFTNQYI